MAINESVAAALSGTNWRKRTLIEVAEDGQLFLITEAEFGRLLSEMQIDEGVRDWLQKARQFAQKLPANLQAAQQYVAKQTGKALDGANAAYVKAQNMINKIPLIGRIPEQTRNRLMLGLALAFAAGVAGHEMAGGHDAAAGAGDHAQAATDAAQGAGDAHAAAGADHAQAATDAAATPAPQAPAQAAAEPQTQTGGGVTSTTSGSGTEADPHTVATSGSPEPHASMIANGPEGNKLFAKLMQSGGSAGKDWSMLRKEFHSVTDRIAMGDITGGKVAASHLAQNMGLDAGGKKELLDLLMKVAQTAKANGVKMH